MISIVVVIFSLTVVISAETGELPIGSNFSYKWAYLTPDATSYRRYPNQLTSSDLVSGADTFMFMVRGTSTNYFNNYYGDYVQLDFYMSFGAATPTLSSDQSYFQGIQLSTAFIGSYPDSSLIVCPVSSVAPVVPIRFTETHSGSSIVYSVLFPKSTITSHIFSYAGQSRLGVMLDVNEVWVSKLNSSNVLMFNSVRIVATDELTIDQDTLLAIKEIQAQIDAGVITLSQGQTAIQNKIDAASTQAHQDAQAVQGAIDSAADQAHEDQEALQTLINGDGSYGSPESEYVDGVDDYEAAESQLLDDVDYDRYFNDDVLVDLKNEVDWDNIDVPTPQSAYFFNKALDPLLLCFPVFVIFPLIIGLLGTLLGRRTRL